MIGAHQHPNLGALDDREWKILALISQGRWSRQIAIALAVSEEALADRIEVILRKLGLKSRLDLWLLAMVPAEQPYEVETASSRIEAMLRR